MTKPYPATQFEFAGNTTHSELAKSMLRSCAAQCVFNCDYLHYHKLCKNFKEFQQITAKFSHYFSVLILRVITLVVIPYYFISNFASTFCQFII